MKILDEMKKKASALKKEIITLYYAFRDPGIPFYSRLLIILTLGYALSPIDLIPDFIPVLGYLDDLIIVPLLISLSIKSIPAQVMLKARQKAETEPLSLKKNWLTGAVFLLIWGIVLFVIIRSIVQLVIKKPQ